MCAVLLEDGRSKTPPNLVDLPPDVQAFVTAQAAELARKEAEMLGLSLSHAAAQKRFKDEMASADAALTAERTAHARARSKAQIPSLPICACNCMATKSTALALAQKAARSWHWN